MDKLWSIIENSNNEQFIFFRQDNQYKWSNSTEYTYYNQMWLLCAILMHYNIMMNSAVIILL